MKKFNLDKLSISILIILMFILTAQAAPIRVIKNNL
jgi:hypothetical protein